jgi:hypothetical protein
VKPSARKVAVIVVLLYLLAFLVFTLIVPNVAKLPQSVRWLVTYGRWLIVIAILVYVPFRVATLLLAMYHWRSNDEQKTCETQDDGPTAKTRARAEVFKKLKDAHPEWSQDKVAQESREELGEVLSSEAVRNAYRAMGWTWGRSDRIR